MNAKIKIKFGKATKGDDAGDSIEYEILGRIGSGDWKVIGNAEAVMSCSFDGRFTEPDQYRIGSMEAYLFSDTDTTFSVDIGRLNRGGKWDQITPVHEAKRNIKKWASAIA